MLAFAVWALVAANVARINQMVKAMHTTQPVAYQPIPDGAFPLYIHVAHLQEALDVMDRANPQPDVMITAGSGKATMAMVHPRLMELHAACDNPCTLQLSQFYYPAWHAENWQGGPEIPLRPASPGGLMELSLPPGQSHVAIILPHDWSERLGGWISLISLIFAIVLFLIDKPRAERLATPNWPAP